MTLSDKNRLVSKARAVSLPGMSHAPIFRYFKTSPEIIRLAVMMFVRYPLSLRNDEDLLHERGMARPRCSSRTDWHPKVLH
jgi:putative transposase